MLQYSFIICFLQENTKVKDNYDYEYEGALISKAVYYKLPSTIKNDFTKFHIISFTLAHFSELCIHVRFMYIVLSFQTMFHINNLKVATQSNLSMTIEPQ